MFNLFKRKETHLLEKGLNEEVIKGFIDKIEDMVCIADCNYKIVYMNKANMQGRYKYFFDLLSYEDNKELCQEIVDTVKKENYFAKDIKIKKNTETVSVYVAVYYFQINNKYIIYIKDTNKYFKNENLLKEKLNQFNEELKSKELFVANLSHEIKTPINIIVAMIYFLKSTKLDDIQMEYINKLEAASDLLTQLVGNILNVTKSDKVNNSINTKEKFVLGELINKVYFIFKDEIEKKNIQWDIKSDFDLNFEVYADKTKVEQVFINLISNAVKYTDKGYIELKVNKISEDFNKYRLLFCITDTGKGIKKEDTIKIFKEFEQTEDPTIKEREGFGLGLPLVRKIIEGMKGKIWVESSFGLGTKFYFELAFDKNIKATDKNIKSGNANIYKEKKVRTNKILLVDDNNIINEITEKILNEINLSCDIVVDGMEAIKKVEENGKDYYDLILMDIHMPKYNGYDISRIMKTELNVTTPIVALTATNITENVIEQNKEYIYSYIQKPVRPEDLKNIIKNIIDKTSSVGDKKNQRETILFLANKIKKWEIFETLSNTFNVICTTNTKDIDLIIETKKIIAIVIDKEENELYGKYFKSIKNTIVLSIEKNENDNAKNFIITNIEGYMKKIQDIDNIDNDVMEIIKRKENILKLENEREDYNQEISDVYNFLYDSLLNLTSIRSKETGAHLKRTQEYIKVMLSKYEELFKTGEFSNQKKIDDIGVAATLHDIGKVAIPDDVLNKPGRLTNEEFDKIKEHTIIGHKILENTNSENLTDDILEYAKEITLHHHEKYDGSGYPDGLKEEEINIISRIMSVIDVYDALVNKRIYKDAMPYNEVEEYIISQSEKIFDPKVVNVFINVKEKLKEINEKYKE